MLQSSNLSPQPIYFSDNRRIFSSTSQVKPEVDVEKKFQSPTQDPLPPSISEDMAFSLDQVLSVAKVHPFYSDVQYPPDEGVIEAIKRQPASPITKGDLSRQPLLKKSDLYTVINRLVNDIRPQNTYRHNVYTSVTGGGSTTSKPLFFATDAIENRRHRAYFGLFLQALGVIERGDWVLTTHCAGNLYRSLDLTCETMENAGASVLAAGNHLHPSKVAEMLRDFNANVLSGDGSQVMSVVHHISMMSSTEREGIHLNKIIYTSEGLTATQRSYINTILGPVKICSVLGSAEAGPYGVNNPDLTSNDENSHLNHTDFVFDTRMIIIEILPLSHKEGDPVPNTLPEGAAGMIAQTSLTRLRNPVVRYLTGDVGSLHSLSPEAQSRIPEEHRRYMRVLRLQGRDQRFSFMWDADDVEFDKLSVVMADPALGVLQWQVILSTMQPSKEVALELRVLRGNRGSEALVVKRLKEFFYVYEPNEHKFQITFLDGMSGFELSRTGQKVVKFIDRCV
ncbi:hypothetical protein CkaCkLH20_08627 [Colletotrichum karsti]|uniref:AMP-dependent synthetase/ligase domain-containing protein n=1 Tax=Colletotrichum karsti TaxID=1095194 RepID=A0A9P6HYG2_9PEZI|nr:uncharacterized protein CkaCkLH20_08627 [Colletotrichum karsti]KAF9873893.1 hypothetical protein CkaCkLH20_08627 [Colletotrichum karsti]